MNRLFCALVFLQFAGQSMAGELRIVPLLDVDPQQTPYKALGVLPAVEESRGWAVLLLRRTRLEYLAWYDADQNGLSHSHRIGLWKNKLVGASTDAGPLFPYLADNELVTQIEIPSGTQAELSGSWRRMPVEPTWLEPGQYQIVGENHAGSMDDFVLWEEQNPTQEGAWPVGLSIGQTDFGPVQEGHWLPPLGPRSGTNVAVLGPMLFVQEIPEPEIPEPTTWLLGLLAAGGTCAGWRSPRRRWRGCIR